jgi:PHD/YefM family antitoxin component YafN of YafNO toxin-antitoxin module
MTKGYTVDEAGARLPQLLAEAVARPVAITVDDRTVAFLITPERLDTLLETREILSNPAAMEAIREARQGSGSYYSLDEFERLLGDEG